MALLEMLQKYGTDEKCREILTKLRWPEGVTLLAVQRARRVLSGIAQAIRVCLMRLSVLRDHWDDLQRHASSARKVVHGNLSSCAKRKRECPLARFNARSESATRRHGISATESVPRWLRPKSRCLTAKSKWMKPMSAEVKYGTWKVRAARQQGNRDRHPSSVAANSASSMRRTSRAEHSQKVYPENMSEDVDVLFTDDSISYRSAAKNLRKQGQAQDDSS